MPRVFLPFLSLSHVSLGFPFCRTGFITIVSAPGESGRLKQTNPSFFIFFSRAFPSRSSSFISLEVTPFRGAHLPIRLYPGCDNIPLVKLDVYFPFFSLLFCFLCLCHMAFHLKKRLCQCAPVIPTSTFFFFFFLFFFPFPSHITQVFTSFFFTLDGNGDKQRICKKQTTFNLFFFFLFGTGEGHQAFIKTWFVTCIPSHVELFFSLFPCCLFCLVLLMVAALSYGICLFDRSKVLYFR
ncbi:hypothetical protein VTN31DRAFT_6305 [Thermomyces dupontii]|uniref:uncharacterized protein n=1 Tax=Talaromyces thermophilus TaxID=28565 RepID=UPI003742CBA2